MKQTGYKMKEYGIPTKRYCRTLDLKDDPELISFDFDWDEAFARLATLPRRRSGGNVYVHLSGCPPGCNICREMADDGADISFILNPKWLI